MNNSDTVTVAELLEKLASGDITLDTKVTLPPHLELRRSHTDLQILFAEWDNEVLTPEEEEEDRRIFAELERIFLAESQE